MYPFIHVLHYVTTMKSRTCFLAWTMTKISVFPTAPLTDNVWKPLLQGIIEFLIDAFWLQLALFNLTWYALWSVHLAKRWRPVVTVDSTEENSRYVAVRNSDSAGQYLLPNLCVGYLYIVVIANGTLYRTRGSCMFHIRAKVKVTCK